MRKLLLLILFAFLSFNVQAQPIPFSILATYDSNATAFNEAGSVASNLDRLATTMLVKGLKNMVLFNQYKLIYPMNGGQSTTHNINLRTVGTNNLTFTGSPTHGTGGVDWNGTTQYANTGLSNSNINENAAHISFYHGETVSGGELGVSWGTDDGTNHAGIFVNYANQFYSDFPNESQGRLQIASIISPLGMISQDLGASRAHVAYRNGSSIGSRTNSAQTAFTSGTLLLNARSIAPDFMGTKILLWWAFAPVAFSSTDVANEYTIVQAYQTLKGRQQ